MLNSSVEPKAQSQSAARAAFRPDIEGLRAIAILLVVGFHAGVPGFSGGYIGVDVFFVLSGYLITGLLVREIEKNGAVDLPNFYARRARRLLPALALTLLVTVIVSVAIYPPFEANQGGFGATAVSTAAYVSNLYFAGSATDYFAPDRERNPLLHTWSLSVEEQFYLIWPIFIMFALGAFAWQGRKKIDRGRLLWWMSAAAASSFALSFYLTSRQQPWAYFSSPTRAWEFALGAIFVLIPEKAGRWSSLVGWIGLAGVGLGAVAFGKTTVFPGLPALLPAVSTGLALRASTTNGLMVRILSTKPLQEIGRLSYSWYLWHWPVIVFGSAIIAAPSLAVRVGLALLSLGIAAASYRLVEDPIRHNRRLASRPVYSFVMAALIAVVGIGTSMAWRQACIWAADKPAQARFAKAQSDGPGLTSDCSANYWDLTVKECNFGTRDSLVPVVLLGDSHAAQWFSALEPMSVARGWRLMPMVKSACAMVDAPFYYGSLGRTYTECAEWRKDALEKIRQIRPLLTVVASTDSYTFDDAQWKDGISRVVNELAASSQNVLILKDTPGAEFDVPTCLARQLWRATFIPTPACEFPMPDGSKVYNFQKLAVRQYPNVSLVDLSSIICPGGVCKAERDNLILYRDSNHLSGTFIRSLQGVLSDQVDKLLTQTKSSATRAASNS